MSLEIQKGHQEAMDLLVDACMKFEYIKEANGQYSKTLILDPEKAWWKTQLVNSPYFGLFAKELLNLEGKASDAKNHMTATRADVLSSQIIDYCLAYRYSIDAKSSETLRDKNNTQPSLIDKLQRSSVPHAYNPKEEVKRSLWKGWVGGDNGDGEERG